MFEVIKVEMLEIASTWDGDMPGEEEERAQMAVEVLGLLTLIETKLFELR